MKLIKIDRSSIKKNKNAGSTTSRVKGRWSASFEIRSEDSHLDLLEREDIFITQHGYEDGACYISGELLRPDQIEEFRQIKGCQIREENECLGIEHPPVPKYSYKYLPQEILCNSCNHTSDWEDIEYDCDEDGFCSYDMCPNCGDTESLEEFEFESIEEALKDVK